MKLFSFPALFAGVVLVNAAASPSLEPMLRFAAALNGFAVFTLGLYMLARRDD